MQSFRAYLLNPAGKIIRGEWIEALSREEAEQQALALCDAGSPKVELWQGPVRLCQLACATTAH